MKLTEAIRELEAAIIEHGDVELKCHDWYGQTGVVEKLYFEHCSYGDFCYFVES